MQVHYTAVAAAARLAAVLIVLCMPGLLQAITFDEPLIINSGRKHPFVQPDGAGFYDLLVKALFKRIGIKAECVYLPSERALINANSGIDAGNIARIEGLEKKYPNLVRVPEKVVDFEFMVYTNKVTFPVNGWESLAPYNVGFVTGWKIFEKNITRARSITKVRNPSQLFELLANERAEVVMFDRWGGLSWMKEHGVKVHHLEPPIAKREMFLYMHKKYRSLVPRLAQELAAMKSDGEYQRIYDKSLKPLLEFNGE